MKINKPIKVKKQDILISIIMFIGFILIMFSMISDYKKESNNQLTGLSIESIQGQTDFTTRIGVEDSVVTLIDTQLKVIGTNKLIQDYLNNYELFKLIEKESIDLGLSQTKVYQALFYHESYYFRDGAIRCEGHYESKWKSLCSKYNNNDCNNLVYCKPSGSHGSSCSLSSSLDTPKVFHRVSCSYGIGQIMFTTALDQGFKGTADELVTDEVSLKYSLLYLKSLSGYSYINDVADLLVSYNSGPGNLRSAKNSNGEGFENYVNALPYPKHSTEYVGRILAYSLIFEDIEKEVQKQLDDGKDLKDIKINQISVSDTKSYVNSIGNAYQFKSPATSEMVSTSSIFTPHFSISFPYNFEIYEYLKEISSKMLNEFKDLNLLDIQLKNKINELNSMNHNKSYKLNFKFGDDCGYSNEQEEDFHSFTEDIYSCSRALNYPCVCEFSKAYPDNYLLEYWDESDYLRITSNNYPLIEIIQNLSIETKFLTHKNYQITGYGLVSKNKLGSVSTNTACDMPPKSIYRFCVETDQTIPIYDPDLDLYSVRNVTYKFALDFANSVSSQSASPTSSGTIKSYNNQNQIHVTSNLNHDGPRTSELITLIGGSLI
jgi:hypothetical protein